MSELPPEGYPEGSRRVWGLTFWAYLKVISSSLLRVTIGLFDC